MKLTKSKRQLLRRLAAGDTLFTDTRRATTIVHHKEQLDLARWSSAA